jgi:hypothetical protein
MVEIPQFIVEEGNRKVMLEEFTGVSCAPCFDGALVVEDIIKSFPGRVIVNGIHGVFQANPTPESKYDFRYEDAAALENSTFIIGKPSALIDRVQFEDQDFLAIDDRDSWKSKIVERLAVPAPVILDATSSYDSNTRNATINITVEALEDLPGIVKIFVIVNESELNDPQLSNSMGLVIDFTHKHVMKDMLTTISGDIIGEDITAGTVVPRTFTYTVPNEVNAEWIPENMEVVYFVTAGGLNDEVLQSEAVHLTE